MLRALGIDPGSRLTGWGLIEHVDGSFVHVASGTIRLRATASVASRLGQLLDEISGLLATYAPDTVALERNFVARNVQSAFRIGEARGVVLAAVARAGVAISEHTPAEVKLAAVGYGRADKTMIGRGIAARLGLRGPLPPDAADALAVALCWLQQAPLLAAVARAGRSTA